MCVGNVASSSSSSHRLPLLPPQSLGGREDEREAEAVIDTAPIDTPPEREIYTQLTTNGQTDRRGEEEEEEEEEAPEHGVMGANTIEGK